MARIKGTSGNNTLTGTAANDVLIGGGGNDILNGGDGHDIAQYMGNLAEYRFSNVDGKLVVTSSGAEGKDTLNSIEALEFGNGQLAVSSAEFQVNTYTTSDQTAPSITALADGGFVVSWSSLGQDSDGWGISAQRYDANGEAKGAELQVNNYTASQQTQSNITGLVDGGFLIVWTSVGQNGGVDNYNVYAQRYDASGVAQGEEFLVNIDVIGNQSTPSVITLADGSFLVSCSSNAQESGSYGIYAKHYDANGIALNVEFRVNTYVTNDQLNSSMTALADGGFVVTWVSLGQDGSSYGVYAQRYNAGDVVQGSEFRVNSTISNTQSEPCIVGLNNGGFVVTWLSNLQDSSGYGVYAQRYSADGVALGAEFKVNTTTTNNQSDPSVTALADGGFIISWTSEGQDGDAYGVYAQLYNAFGVAQGGEFQVNTYVVGNQYNSSVTGLADGGFVVSWASSGQDGDGYGIYAQRFDAAGNAVVTKLTGTANADVINLNPGDAGLVVDGAGGNDTINGAAANDTLLGGANNDSLVGGAGDDYLDGGAGVDKLIGGTGDDVYIFGTGDTITELANAGVDTVQSSVTHTLSANVENLTLTGAAAINGTGNTQANLIIGNAGNNQLDGKTGADVIDGGTGNDTLIGGAGNDLLEGGVGNDFFRFNTALSVSTNVDEVIDFNVMDDTMQLSKTIFTTIGAGSAAGIALDSTMFNSGAFNVAQDASDRIIYNSSTGDLYYDKDGTGAAAAIKFAHLDTGLSLTHADFSVIL